MQIKSLMRFIWKILLDTLKLIIKMNNYKFNY